MSFYNEVIESLKGNTFEKHIKRLNQIQGQTTDSELKVKISNLISSLGSKYEFDKRHNLSTIFEINFDTNQSAADLINYCKQQKS